MIGADIIAKSLQTNGVRYLFDYPGGCTVFILDSIRRLTDIQIITCRHEQGAVFAACGYAKSTGKPGVCLATSGPGATNLITGIADAYFDHTPLIAITGQVPSTLYRTTTDRQSGFQEINITEMVRPITIYAKYISTVYKLDQQINDAFRDSLRLYGPILLDLPIDLQRKQIK